MTGTSRFLDTTLRATGPARRLDFVAVRQGKFKERRGLQNMAWNSETGRVAFVPSAVRGRHRTIPKPTKCTLGWPEGSKEFAYSLLKTGQSASRVAAQLLLRFGIHKTRNAVIGISYRADDSVGLPKASKATRSWTGRIGGRRIAKRRRLATENIPPLPKRPAPMPDAELPPRHETDVARVSFIDLEDHHCRFIPGDPAPPHEKQFCGAERRRGSAYCNVHAIRCGESVRVSEPYEPKRIGRILLNTNGPTHEFESA